LSARRCRTCGAVRGGAGRALGTGRVTRQKHATRRRRRTMDDRATDRRRIQPRSVSRINLSTGAAAPLHQRRVTTVYTDVRLPPSSHAALQILDLSKRAGVQRRHCTMASAAGVVAKISFRA